MISKEEIRLRCIESSVVLLVATNKNNRNEILNESFKSMIDLAISGADDFIKYVNTGKRRI